MGPGVYVRFLFRVKMFKRNMTASTMDKTPLYPYTSFFFYFFFFCLIRLWCYGYGYGELEDLISCALFFICCWRDFYLFLNIRLHLHWLHGLLFRACLEPLSWHFHDFWIEIYISFLTRELNGKVESMAGEGDLFILKYSPFKWLHNAWGHSRKKKRRKKKQVSLVRDLMFSARLFNILYCCILSCLLSETAVCSW